MIVFSTLRQTVGGDGCVSKAQGVRGGNRRQGESAKGGGGKVWKEREEGGKVGGAG